LLQLFSWQQELLSSSLQAAAQAAVKNGVAQAQHGAAQQVLVGVGFQGHFAA
jgi:hypothetical protein